MRENMRMGWGRMYVMSLSKTVEFPLTCTRQVALNQPEMEHHFFQLYINDEILENIVAQTQLYANLFIAAHTIGPRSHIQQWSWQEFSRDELKRFIALTIVMGLINFPQMEDHWVTSWPYSSQTCSKVHRQ